jgi:tetratricopeptide (TPR) repeat protein
MTSVDAHALLAQAAALRAQGKLHDAIAIYEAVLQKNPQLSNSWYNLGLLRRRIGEREAALRAYDEALKRGVESPEEVHLNKAVILSDDLRRPDEARRELGIALRLNPGYVPALLNLGNLAEDLGQISDAIDAYERVLSRFPHHAVALSRLSGMGAAWKDHGVAVDRLRSALAAVPGPAEDRASLLFALAQRLDAARRFDEAFATASEARASSLLAAGLAGARHDRVAMERRVAMQREAFAAPEPRATTRDPVQPVFIVGMFRSGSTLLEQILSAHDAVHSGGELPLVPRIAQLLRPYPAVVAGASRTQLDQLAAVYLAEVRKIFPDAGVVTDKRPDNFEHVGLIKRMFPNARIIYTRRNPLDICVSTHFLHIDAAVTWASSPADTAHQIVQCSYLMAHWLQLYPDDILTVDYERLLAEPESQTRAILSFLDLPWSESCMAFHAARTQVRTASVWQVREALHHRAIGRWRNYAWHLGDADAMLRAAGLIND